MRKLQGAAAEAKVPEAYNAVMLRGGGLLGAVLALIQPWTSTRI